MEAIVGYCGITCSECPAHKATQRSSTFYDDVLKVLF